MLQQSYCNFHVGQTKAFIKNGVLGVTVCSSVCHYGEKYFVTSSQASHFLALVESTLIHVHPFMHIWLK